MAISQRHRHLSVQTVLGDSLAVASFTYTEQLGRLFSGELDLISESADVDFDKLVGTPVTVCVQDSDGVPRYFNGIASRFIHTGWSGRYASYRLTLVPTMWLLSRTSDCRIFQDQTIPQILKTVLEQYGVAGDQMEFKLQANYTPWEYCVQYRETALNFVCRLMEHEGIYFYFQHINGAHKLTLVDSLTAHKPCKGAETIYYEGRNKRGVKKAHGVNSSKATDITDANRALVEVRNMCANGTGWLTPLPILPVEANQIVISNGGKTPRYVHGLDAGDIVRLRKQCCGAMNSNGFG